MYFLICKHLHGDLLMHTSRNNEHYEHELECNKQWIAQLLFVLSGLYIFDVHF